MTDPEARFPETVYSTTVTRLRAAGCVFAEDEARLLHGTADGPDDLEAMIRRRTGGLPLEVVLGWAEFCGLRIAVDAGVFVPRRRTEFLVHQAIALGTPGAVLVDLCCGTGAIGLAVATALHRPELHATESDPVAAACARRNIPAGLGQVHEGDLYQPLPDDLRGRVTLLVVNAPYVPTEAIGLMPPEARLHEPRTALDGGADGLAIQRRVAADAPRWLAPGGHLLIETSLAQAEHTAAALTGSGLRARVEHSAELDATVVIGSTVVTGGTVVGSPQ